MNDYTGYAGKPIVQKRRYEMKELLEQAAEFLKNHLEINEVELKDGNIAVHLVRCTPTPTTYSDSGWGWQYTPQQ